MNINIKRLSPESVIPSYSSEGDAGMDLTAISRELFTGNDNQADFIEYGTGLAVEIPEGYVGLIFPRSSISKQDLSLANAVGVIDSNYRGEIKLRFKLDAMYDAAQLGTRHAILTFDGNTMFQQCIYAIGERVGQLIVMPYPKVNFIEVDELQQTSRGNNGFGSTGQ